MKVHVLWPIADGAAGGGNHALRTLRGRLRARECYAETPQDADVLIVNSKDNHAEALHWRKTAGKRLLLRVDGVFGLYRGPEHEYVDRLVHAMVREVDGVVYQSEWARGAHGARGMPKHTRERVIHNAADPAHYYPACEAPETMRVISVSWSSNPKKGYALLRWLDEQPELSDVEHVFVGRAPGAFRRIKKLGILEPAAIGDQLRRSSVYVSATRHDACSNALIEAMACRLFCIALASGGNAELIKTYTPGWTYDSSDELLGMLLAARKTYPTLRRQIRSPDADAMAEAYLEVLEAIMREARL